MKMGVEEVIDGNSRGENDKFPVGMRVLAVDDDKTCLKVLEKLLQKCNYQVTTANEAKVALEMLRENRNRFDIIITDVHMPDMDGFKLLEFVGLEMDLPVIMLSVNSDPKLVMKGITHGACDYLVKPVRLEELKNIWQHVIRKNKREPKHPNKRRPEDNIQQGNGDSGNGSFSNASFDQNGKRTNRKRIDDDRGNGTFSNASSDQNGKRTNRKKIDDDKRAEEEDDDEEGEDYGSDSDERGTQKKPRVVWSMDLHKKFVVAVNQLGIGKGAVPKRILEHMNVEGLTRENVASHLQKYRLYLKRIESAATLTNIRDPSMPINSFDGVGDLRAQGRFSHSAMSSYQTGAVLNRLNAPSGGSLISSSSLIQTNNRSQNITNSFSALNKLDPGVLQTNQSASTFRSESTLYPGNINLVASSISNLPSAPNWGIFSNQSSNILSKSSFFSEGFNRNTLVSNGINENHIYPASSLLNNPLDFCSTNVVSTSVHDSRGEGLFNNFRSTSNLVAVNGVISPFSHSFDQNNRFSQRRNEKPSMMFQNSGLPTLLQQNGSEKMVVEPNNKPDGEYFLEQWRSQGTGYDTLDELMNPMPKVDQEGNMLMDGEFGIDAYNF